MIRHDRAYRIIEDAIEHWADPAHIIIEDLVAAGLLLPDPPTSVVIETTARLVGVLGP